MSNYLRLLGGVKSKILEQVGINPHIGKSKVWFFVDTAKSEYALNTLFDVRLSDDITKIEGFIHLRLVKILDEKGREVDSIAVGAKTICQFQFVEKLPSVFATLNILNTWELRSKSAIIANAKQLEIKP